MYLAGGVCWLLFAAGFGFFVLQFLAQGAGWQFFGLEFVFDPAISSGSLLTGMACTVGLLTAAAVCFVVSLWLFSRGFIPQKEKTR